MASWNRPPRILSVRVDPTGDRASAATPAAILLAARTLLADARGQGCGDPRASLYCHGRLVRSSVKRSEL